MKFNNIILQEDFSALIPIFGQKPVFISDSEEIVNLFRHRDHIAYNFEDVFTSSPEIKEVIKENVVLIGVDNTKIPSYTDLHELFRKSRVLMIPLGSFDSSMEATIYTLNLLAQSDIDFATKLNAKWVNLLLNRKMPMILHGNGSNFTCQLEDNLYVMAPKTEVQLALGEWDTIGSYFEVGMVPTPDDIRPGFVVNGTLTVPGVAVAHHRQMPEELCPLAHQAWQLFQQLRKEGRFPLHIDIRDSRVVQVLAGEKDISSELIYLRAYPETRQRNECV
jgi:hypothetical protein